MEEEEGETRRWGRPGVSTSEPRRPFCLRRTRLSRTGPRESWASPSWLSEKQTRDREDKEWSELRAMPTTTSLSASSSGWCPLVRLRLGYNLAARDLFAPGKTGGSLVRPFCLSPLNEFFARERFPLGRTGTVVFPAVRRT